MTHHICNIHFEEELAGKLSGPLESSFRNSYLPFLELPKLWAKEGDTVFPTLPQKGQTVDSWGPSKLVLSYAQKQRLQYTIPDWNRVRDIHSKAFAHTLSPIPYSAILYNENDLQHWLDSVPPPHVFKKFYDFSGKGHLFKPIDLPYPVLAEPWVERTLDFSTQWTLTPSQTLHYIGATVQKISEKGRYLGCVTGKEEEIFGPFFSFFQEHVAFIYNILPKLEGFFGNFGVDAFIYHTKKLQPLCEINTRKTLGFVARKLFEKYQPTKQLTLHFGEEMRGIPILSLKQLKYVLE
jgi:hypothetical protein